MEVVIVLLAAAIAVAALLLAVLVAGRQVKRRQRPRLPGRAPSGRGLAWLALGLSTTAVFIYLDIPVIISLPVVITGIVYLVRDARGGGPHGEA